jgi:hypothetical protein
MTISCENFLQLPFFSIYLLCPISFQFTDFDSFMSFYACVKVGNFLPSSMFRVWLFVSSFPTLCFSDNCSSLHTFFFNLFSEYKKRIEIQKKSMQRHSFYVDLEPSQNLLWCNAIHSNLIQMHPTVWEWNLCFRSMNYNFLFFFLPSRHFKMRDWNLKSWILTMGKLKR